MPQSATQNNDLDWNDCATAAPPDFLLYFILSGASAICGQCESPDSSGSSGYFARGVRRGDRSICRSRSVGAPGALSNTFRGLIEHGEMEGAPRC